MSRGLLGAVTGAGAATAYYKPEVLTDFIRDAAFNSVFGPGRSSSSAAGGDSKELEHLYKLVEQLSKDVHAKQPVTIVHTGGVDKGTSYVLYTTATLGLGTVLYFKIFRGWSVGDFMYVTRRGLRQGITQVTSGLEALSGKVTDIKTKLQARIAELGRKQDETIAAQAALKQQLSRVGGDVEVTRGQVGQIHGLVLDMEATMSEVGANQRHANHGIFILCKAVSELMQGSNIPSKADLIEYTQQHPVWAGDRVQGLEGVLRGHDENSCLPRGPFLLPEGSSTAGSASRVISPVKVQSPDSDSGSPPRHSMPSVSYPVHVGGGQWGLRSSTLHGGW